MLLFYVSFCMNITLGLIDISFETFMGEIHLLVSLKIQNLYMALVRSQEFFMKLLALFAMRSLHSYYS